jgi:hypothetical protein
VRRLVVGLTCLGATVLLGGCYRRKAPPTLPAVIHAPELPPAAPDAPEMAASLPLPDSVTVAPPVKVTEVKPRPRRRTTPRSPASDASAPVDTANAEPLSDDTSIGELSAGGDANSTARQDASTLIDSSERRLNGLSQAVVHQQQAQVRKVRYFLKQAKQALSTGDAEGAKTLATKAKLLIDDLVK